MLDDEAEEVMDVGHVVVGFLFGMGGVTPRWKKLAPRYRSGIDKADRGIEYAELRRRFLGLGPLLLVPALGELLDRLSRESQIGRAHV